MGASPSVTLLLIMILGADLDVNGLALSDKSYELFVENC